MSATATTDQRVHAWDYGEVRHRHAGMPDTVDAGIQDIIVRLLEPTGSRGPLVSTGSHLMAECFFPLSVKKKFTAQRMKYLRELDDYSIPWLWELTHRGFGKTTLGIIFCTRGLALRLNRFLLYTSAEYKIAAKRTEAIRAAFMCQEFQDVFGTVEPRRNQKASAAFSEEAFFLIDPETQVPFACVSPRGANQTVNGSLVSLGNMFVRPDLLFSDDGQSRKHIWNEDVRERFEEWFDAEYSQTVEADEQPGPDNRWKVGRDGRVPYRNIVVDTCKHRNALMMQLRRRSNWRGNVFPIAREVAAGRYESCTELLTNEQVQAMYERLKTKPDYWAREFLCEPRSSEEACYASNMWSYVQDEELMRTRPPTFRFLVVDPARTGGHRANKTSILAVGVDPELHRIYLRRNIVRRMDPDVYYRAIFSVARDTRTAKIYVEDTGLSDVIRNAIRQAAELAGVAGRVEFDWLQSRRHPGVDYGSGSDAIKIARAGAMLPYYREGVVVHDESLREGPLERALLEFPECSEWDATDTLGYIPEILEREGIYFEGGDFGETWDEDEDEEYERAGRFFRSRAWCN